MHLMMIFVLYEDFTWLYRALILPIAIYGPEMWK